MLSKILGLIFNIFGITMNLACIAVFIWIAINVLNSLEEAYGDIKGSLYFCTGCLILTLIIVFL